MIRFLKKIFDIILPQRCLLCGKVVQTSDTLCPDCFENITFITAPYCQHCGKALNTPKEDAKSLCCAKCLQKKDILRMSRAAICYDDKSKKLLLDFKFRDHVENKKLFARWLNLAGTDIFNAGIDLIIPVPLHYTRLLKRKYNQSAILASELSKIVHIPATYKILKKIRKTLPQVQCSGPERKKNVRNAFRITNPEMVKGKRIVLIDDIYTTGSTIKECAKALKKAGAKSVDALTIAKVCDNN